MNDGDAAKVVNGPVNLYVGVFAAAPALSQIEAGALS